MRQLNEATLKALGTTNDEFFGVEREIAPKIKITTGHPIEIKIAMDRTFGTDWPEWEESTVAKHARGAFGDLTRLDIEKIYALQAAIANTRAWDDFDVFENVCCAFSGKIPIWGTIQPLNLHELAFGVGCLDAIKEIGLSDEVVPYIVATLNRNGVLLLPDDNPFSALNADLGDILRPHAKELSALCIDAWDKGRRANDDDFFDDEDPVEVQLYKYKLLSDWYHLGKDYLPDV